MLATVLSCTLLGIDALLVEVEVDITGGLPRYSIVGLPEGAVKESKERIRSALRNSGFDAPNRRTTVNLAPADVRKEGSAFDLPIALGILAATGQLPAERLRQYSILGELSLDGRVKPVRGALPIAASVREKKLTGVLLPPQNAREAAVVGDIEIIPIENLSEACRFLRRDLTIEPLRVDPVTILNSDGHYDVDFSEVKGQEHVRRALEVAAAGGHNVIMVGPPGSGKTMLARRLPTILPAMTLAEAIETTRIHSVMGLMNGRPLVTTRPFRAPHHTISDAGLIGGGAIPRPGEISIAHNGVLFLDELPEFRKNVLEVLREPLEERRITISRAIGSLTFPAGTMLVAAFNPCPCGYHGDPGHNCTCTPQQIQRYRSRISGPLLDRIDIQIEVPAVRYRDLAERRTLESSADIRARVNRVRAVQLERFAGRAIFCNAQMSPRDIARHCKVDTASERLLETAIAKLGLSVRAYTRILKVARTIADLNGSADIASAHVAEAIQYRSLDRMMH